MILSQKLLTRHRELKQEVPDGLLLMQVGAFMQVMDEDARTVSQVTGLKLQMAGEVDDPVVMGGFPRSAPATRWRWPCSCRREYDSSCAKIAVI
jgi:DNA mismatch repair ATPase MutS